MEMQRNAQKNILLIPVLWEVWSPGICWANIICVADLKWRNGHERNGQNERIIKHVRKM